MPPAIHNIALLQVTDQPVKLFFINDLPKFITGGRIIGIERMDACF